MSVPGSANSLLLGSAAGGYEISRSLRFNSSDSAYLSRTPASAGNRKTWTWAGWVKRNKLSTYQTLFWCRISANTNDSGIGFTNTDQLRFVTGTSNALITNAVFRDTGAWMHVVCAFDTTQSTAANRIKLYVNGVEQTYSTTSYPTQNADWSINSTSEHGIGRAGTAAQYYADFMLADIHFIDGQALDPTSFGEFDDNGIWQPKKFTGTYGTNGFKLDFADNSSNTATTLGKDTSGNGNNWTVNNITVVPVNYAANIDLVNGDPITSGDNIYAIFDGNSSTGAETNDGLGNNLLFDFANGTGSISVSSNIQVWVGGSDGRTLKVNGSVIATNTGIGNNPHTITGQSQLDSVEVISESSTRSGYLLQISVDGNALITNDPKNDDSLVDVPTNGVQPDTGVGGEVRGNYCTWNPLANKTNTLSNGNLDIASASGNADSRCNASIAVSSGKWYYEITLTEVGTNSSAGIGQNQITSVWPGNDALSYAYELDNARTAQNGNLVAYGSALGVGDIFMCAFDLDNNKIFFGKNGTWFNSSNPATGASPAFTLSAGIYTPIARPYDGNTTGAALAANFGQRPFAYTAPSGFKALNTSSLPAPVVTKPSSVFDVVTYTGTGSTLTPTSSLGFNPDLVWIKSRSAATDNTLYDSVRGVQARLESNNTDAEVTSDNGLTAFNSNGFTLGTLAQVNTNAATYAGWCWDAGSSTVTNTAGSITSSVRANTSAGFSIVTYTGTNVAATIGHGLGARPSFIITKSRTGTQAWYVYHQFLTTSQYLLLNTTAAVASISGLWDTLDSSTFGFLPNAQPYVAYCFAPVNSYSAFGSYTGNGSADGPFVYTGFRSRWILIKNASVSESWIVFDTARNTYNVVDNYLYANEASAENRYGALGLIDILSNGFKFRRTELNASGNTFVYAAFAENPFQYARAR